MEFARVGFLFDVDRREIWAFLPPSRNVDAKSGEGGYIGIGNTENGLKTQENAEYRGGNENSDKV